MFYNILTLILCFLFPTRLIRGFLNLIGHDVDKSARIGFSVIWKTKLILGPNCRIGDLNIISVEKLDMGSCSLIRDLNIIFGSFDVILSAKARIGKQNNISRSKSKDLVIGTSKLFLGELACITKKTTIDLTSSFSLGNFSQIAGVGTQIWTHGYVHADSGPGRFRVDGEVNIGNNVYVGSKCLINPGVHIGDKINIGGNSTISKDLLKPGMYVSQPLRFLDKNYDSIKNGLFEISDKDLIERVYLKKKKS